MEIPGETPVLAPGPEPEVPRSAFVPPELLARRYPAPHSAALTLPYYQQAQQARQAAQQTGEPPTTSYNPAYNTGYNPAAYGPATQGSVLTASPTGPATSGVAEHPGAGQGVPAGVDLGAVPAGGPAAPLAAGRRRGPLLLLAGVAVVLVIAAVVGYLLHQHVKSTVPPVKHAATAPAVTETTLKATVTSFDPKGSGFRRVGDGYRTQRYTTATFGNLKAGVGLALDLGSAKDVSKVSFDVQQGPLTVRLYAADQPASQLSGYTGVGSSTSADGPTTLSAPAGGQHRYWLVWVTRLGSHAGGYTAQVGGVKVTGRA